MEPTIPIEECRANAQKMLRENQLISVLQDEHIAKMVQNATYEEHLQGATIFNQGDPAEHFYFILDGQIRVIDETKKPPLLINLLHEDQFFGELGLIHNQPRSAKIDVVVDVLVAKFSKALWQELVDLVPAVKDRFAELEEEYEAHATIPFDGRHFDEVTLLNTDRHILAYLVTLTGPLTLFIGAPVIQWLLNDFGVFTAAINWLIPISATIVAVIWGVYNYIEWVNDDFIVSTKRIIHIERTIIAGEHREEAPLTRVHDVQVKTSNFFTRTFGYSDVIIRMAGAGTIVFDGVPQGDKIKELIFDQMEHAKEREKAQEIASLRTSLADSIQWHGGPLEAQKLASGEGLIKSPPKKRRLPKPLYNLLRYYIPIVREESDGVITWRKHHWVWLGHVWLPAVVGAVNLFFLGESLYYTGWSSGTWWLVAGLPIVWFWYTYQHDDWHKDIYMVTGTKIIHQDSTAFRLRGEEISQTTFDAVQNIDYKMPNFFARMLKMGNVVIKTASVGDNFEFEKVYFPRDVQQEIFKRWVKFKEVEKKKSRAHQEEMFTTWLGEYHKLMRQKN